MSGQTTATLQPMIVQAEAAEQIRPFGIDMKVMLGA